MIVVLNKVTRGLDEVIAGVGEIVEKSAPVNGIVTTINQQLDAGVDARGPAREEGRHDRRRRPRRRPLRRGGRGRVQELPESATTKAPRIGEVYTRGTLTLARLGREAPIAAANPAGPVLRNVEGGSLAARQLYPEIRQSRPERLPRSPVIGTDAPVQYEQRDDIGAPRKRLPTRLAAAPNGPADAGPTP